MKIIKKKTKKKKSLTSKKQPKKSKNFDGIGYIKNPYAEAAKVKDWKELEKFISTHAAALGPAGVAYASVKFLLDNYNEIKINYEHPDAVLDLIKEIEKHSLAGGARKLYQEYFLNTRNKGPLEIDESDGPLARFKMETGYAVPKTEKTFQEHVTMFKDHFGLKRKKKKVPHLRDVEFKI
mgnify:FL=1